MKTIVPLGFISLLLGSCYSPQNNCKKFKTGTFEYQTYANGELMKARIVRNDSMEIDYSNDQQPDTASIRWINDCEYVVRKYHPKTQIEKQAYQIKIIKTHKDSYTFEFSKVGDEQKVKSFTAHRVE